MSDPLPPSTWVPEPVLPLTTSTGTALTVEQWRAIMPAFKDVKEYTDGYIAFWLNYADHMLQMPPWTEPPRSLAMALFAAHWIAIDKRDENAAESGGVPGNPSSGIMTSKSVGGVSVGYDTSLSTEQGAGTWNMTTYGARFYRLMRLAGMAGTQLGGPDMYLNDSFGPAWPGVIYPK